MAERQYWRLDNTLVWVTASARRKTNPRWQHSAGYTRLTYAWQDEQGATQMAQMPAGAFWRRARCAACGKRTNACRCPLHER